MSHKKSNIFIMDAIIRFSDGRPFFRRYIGLVGKRIWGVRIGCTNNGVGLEHVHTAYKDERVGSEDVCIIGIGRRRRIESTVSVDLS